VGGRGRMGPVTRSSEPEEHQLEMKPRRELRKALLENQVAA
jgi:hypothetical protein